MESDSQFRFEIETPAPDIVVYRLSGRLYGKPECFAFLDEVHDRVKSGQNRVILDMQGIERIDSTGVGILAGMFVSIQNAKGKLLLAALSPAAERILDVAWFLRMVEHQPTIDEALARLEQKGPAAG